MAAIEAITAEEKVKVEAQRARIIGVEEKRNPVYAAKIELRRKLWGKMCAILEGGQAENLRLISAMKEKLKVEKAYASGLKAVGVQARPKGTKTFLPMDELLGDQQVVAERLATFNDYIENEVIKVMDGGAGEYASQVSVLHKRGVDLIHCFGTANEMATCAHEEFVKVTEPKAIDEQNKIEKKMAEGDDGPHATDDPDTGLPVDLWISEMKYHVATIFAENSFKMYDDNFASLIADLKAAESKRRTDINKIMFDMIRKQEEIKYTVADTGNDKATLKPGLVKDERYKELQKKEEAVKKDQDATLEAGMAQFDEFATDQQAGYPDLQLGSPLKTAMIDCYFLGAFKGSGLGSGFALGLIVRTVDDHIHVFAVPKGSEMKACEDIFAEFIPSPHVPKEHKVVAKKVGSKVASAPEKGDASKTFKAKASLVSPSHSIILNLTEAFKVNNTTNDIVLVEKIKRAKGGTFGGKVKTTKSTLRQTPTEALWKPISEEDLTALLQPYEVHESEQSYKDSIAPPPKA